MDNFLRNIFNTSTALPYAAHLVVDVWQESVVEILNCLLSQLQSNPQFQVQLTVNIPDLLCVHLQSTEGISLSILQHDKNPGPPGNMVFVPNRAIRIVARASCRGIRQRLRTVGSQSRHLTRYQPRV